MCMHRYLATVHDIVCLDVLSCRLVVFVFFLIGMVLLELKVLLCAGMKNPELQTYLCVLWCGYLLLPVLGNC